MFMKIFISVQCAVRFSDKRLILIESGLQYFMELVHFKGTQLQR